MFLGEAWHLGAVGGASALALAAVLAGAAVITGFASALAFTVILAFTGVFGGVEVRTTVAQTGLHDLGGVCGCGGLRGRVGRDGASAGQASESSGEKHCVELVLHGDFDLILGMGRMFSADWGKQDGWLLHPAESVVRNLGVSQWRKVTTKTTGQDEFITLRRNLAGAIVITLSIGPRSIGCCVGGTLVCLSLELN